MVDKKGATILQDIPVSKKDEYSHGHVQGLLVMIGRLLGYKTYVPAQDQTKKFEGVQLKEVADLTKLSSKYDDMRTVDVIWLTEDGIPSHLYEVENTTDIQGSLIKFGENRHFNVKFFIVADKKKRSRI